MKNFQLIIITNKKIWNILLVILFDKIYTRSISEKGINEKM